MLICATLRTAISFEANSLLYLSDKSVIIMTNKNFVIRVKTEVKNGNANWRIP